MRRKNGVPLTLELVIPTGYAPSANLANLLVNDWGAIGVGVTIHPYATSQFFLPAAAGGPVLGGKFDAAIFSSGSGPVFANISGSYDCAGIPPNGFNAERYCNHVVDALNDRYVHSFDPAVRARAAASFQRIIDADAPVIIFYARIFSRANGPAPCLIA